MKIDTARIRELAQKATGGPWEVRNQDELVDGNHHPLMKSDCPYNCAVYFKRDADAAYVAAANPETMLALLGYIDELHDQMLALKEMKS